MDGAVLAVIEHPTWRCVVCGEDLWKEHWWMIEHPTGAHERCMDWSTRPFPFLRYLDVLRILARRTTGDTSRNLGRLLTAMHALARRWPNDPLADLEIARRIVSRARPLVAHLPERDRQRLG